MAKYIGMSLSNCIKDIIEGKIKADEVKFIISSTRIRGNESFSEVCRIYKETCWAKNPKRGKELAAYFYYEGKLIQPRLDPRFNEELLYIGSGHWYKLVE